MTDQLTAAEHLKFRLLSVGLQIDPSAEEHIAEVNGDRPLTPADYASTSGVILALDDDVWVNAPIERYNPNFVSSSPFRLHFDGEALVVEGEGLASRAGFWVPPAYHGRANEEGEEYNSYAFTHADRVRISPIEGCSMACKFCNLPYEFRYRTKRVAGLVDAVRIALEDPLQPAHHVLISGGTPRERDVEYVRECYATVASTFPDISVDVMMVPRDGLMDPEWLKEAGVEEVSVNLEIYDEAIGRSLMRQKAAQGRDTYLDYLEHAAGILGPGKVRSMLMVGLEPLESTLKGARAIAERGAVPVLSPFRPDESTPLAGWQPPESENLEEVYLRALEIATDCGVGLGPSCIPCSHNTLTLAGIHGASRSFGIPRLVR